jgi:hypothetical protein
MAADHQAINVSTIRPVSYQQPTEASDQSCHITVNKKKSQHQGALQEAIPLVLSTPWPGGRGIVWYTFKNRDLMLRR